MLQVSSSSSSTLQSPYQRSPVVTGTTGSAHSTASATTSLAGSKSIVSTSGGSSSGSSNIPQAVTVAIASYVAPTQQAWTTLAQALKSGNVSSAQTALADYTTALSAAAGTMAAPSTDFLNDLTALGDSLKTGEISTARAAFASAATDAPSTAAEDVYWSKSKAALDGWITVYGLEHNTAITDPSTLKSDIAGVDDALREEGNYIAAALKSKGYDGATARHYGAEITGIDLNGSAQDNSQVDTDRAAQWTQGLIALTQGKVAPIGYSDLQPAAAGSSGDAVSDELSSILFASASNSGRLLLSLIDHASTGNADSTQAVATGTQSSQ